MLRPTTVVLAILLLIAPAAFSQERKKKVKPNVNASREYAGVYHSPSAEATPRVFRSVIQLEMVVRRGDDDPEVVYADGTVVSADGLIATVLDAPGTNQDDQGGIVSASLLMLDGSGAGAEVVAYDSAHGVAILRAAGVNLRHLPLSTKKLVAKQRVSWHAIYRDGRKTWLYTRPLRIHEAACSVRETTDLCRIIDMGTSALSPERSGSALVALDGSVVALMGRQPHWTVTPRNTTPRLKLAWAVPAHVIAELVAAASSQ